MTGQGMAFNYQFELYFLLQEMLEKFGSWFGRMYLNFNRFYSQYFFYVNGISSPKRVRYVVNVLIWHMYQI